MSLKSQIFPSQGAAFQLFSDARLRAQQYDFQGAAQILERALKLEPANDKILLDLGSVYARAYNFCAAERCFENAIAVSPKKMEARNTAAHYWLEVRNYEAAKNYFEQILNEPQPLLAAMVKLAEFYVRVRRLDDAAAIADRAMQAHPNHEAALLTRAKVHRQMKELSKAEELCRKVVSNQSCPAEGRAAAWYELAAVLDQQKDFDAAFAAFSEAKALLNLMAARPAKLWRTKQARIGEIQKNISAEVIRRWQKAGQTDLQPARKLTLLCGEARSGTTLLENVLDAHPQLVSADETTVFYHSSNFAISQALSGNSALISGLDWLSSKAIREIRANYFRGMESFLNEPIGERVLLDKNPEMTFDIPVICRIFPEIKFLVALRDPRDVCLSCFMQPAPLLPDTVAWLSVEGTIEHYASIMGFWLASKPAVAESALEVRYENMVENLEGISRRVLEFLGLPWNEEVLRFNEHASKKVVHSPTFAEVTKPIFKSSIGRWKNYQKHFESHFEKLQPFFKAFGYE